MDPTRILEADHREAEDLIAKIKKAEGQERKPLVDKLKTALEAHMAVEEQILYPSSKSVVGDEEVEEATNEHKIAKDALRDLVALSPDEPGIGAAIDMLEAAIKHHVKDEEDEFFPKLRSEGAEMLQTIEEPFLQKRSELGMETPAEKKAS
jgi:iron-sulfur cluster repair protein YtfE (RIC family)